LWHKVVEASVPAVQKHALLFYIIRDCRHLHNADTTFARKVHLPAKYRLFVTGLWELDHCQFNKALEYLTDPTLTPTFPDEILAALLRHPRCDDSLATAYYITVQPPMRDPKTLEMYFDLLLRTNIVEAYHFCQKQDAVKHKSLFEKMVAFVHEQEAGEARAQTAALLVGLPFSDEEEIWFEQCLLTGSASSLPDAKDTVMMRRLVRGKPLQVRGALSTLRGQKVNGVNWDDVRKSMEQAVVT